MIEVVLCDIDGCLTGGEGTPIDFDGLKAVGEFNRRRRAGEPVPAVTLCTGRPSPYVELMAQLIDCHLPCIYEHGCGLYDPVKYRFERNAGVSKGTDGLIGEARRRIETELVDRGMAFVQPGKEHSLSVFPAAGYTTTDVQARVETLMADLGPALHTLHSVTCLEVLPAGVTKGSGAEALSRAVGVPLSRFAGIGDSPSDQPFLDVVAFSAAPANGSARLRVNYRAKREFVAGVLEVLELLRNGVYQTVPFR